MSVAAVLGIVLIIGFVGVALVASHCVAKANAREHAVRRLAPGGAG